MVVKGEKVFTLLPPAAAPFLHEQRCMPGEFARTQEGGWTVVPDAPDTPLVPWIPVDVAKPDLCKYPDAAKAPSVEVRVKPGEMLYLPAMWYHRVAQEGVTIGVNF